MKFHPPFLFMQFSLRFYLLLSGACITLLSHWFPLDEKYQLIFMVASFVVFGIPHGALDLYIEEGFDEKADLRKVFFRYILFSALYIGLWYLNPAAALVIFIVITAFHFGEIDWIGRTRGGIKKILYFLLGLCWILFLLSHHVNEALRIFESITRYNINKTLFLEWAEILFPFSLAGMLSLFVFFFFKKDEYFAGGRLWYFAAGQQLALVLMALFTPLWIFFAFYFGIWHSLLSLDKIRFHFKLNSTLHDWLFLLRKALPFSVLAWIGILYFIFLTVSSTDAAGMLSLVFIGLAVLTVPHLQVFTKLNR